MRGWFAGMVLMMAPISGPTDPGPNPDAVFSLPAAAASGGMSVEDALQQRRSVRSYRPEPLRIGEIAQLLWAAQGVSEPRQGLRTAPSAGATFPLEVDLLVSGIPELADGVYRYRPLEHALELRLTGDLRRPLQEAALGQKSIGAAPVVLVISGVIGRTAARYGARAGRYMHMEAGHAAQNVYLQGTALGIGTVVIGAFRDDAVSTALRLERSEEPLYILPLGRMR